MVLYSLLYRISTLLVTLVCARSYWGPLVSLFHFVRSMAERSACLLIVKYGGIEAVNSLVLIVLLVL